MTHNPLLLPLALAVMCLGGWLWIRTKVTPTTFSAGLLLALALIVRMVPRAVGVRNGMVLSGASLVSMGMSAVSIVLLFSRPVRSDGVDTGYWR
jgi:hypothetical protein